MEKNNGTILAIRCPWQRQRRFAAFAAVTLFLLVFSISKPSFFTRGLYTPSQTVYGTTTKSLVPLEAHIMSKCPDARECLSRMILPAMQRVHQKVNFTLSFIGRPTSNDGVDCMHGPDECMGNIIELCVAHLYPSPVIYLGFAMCLSREYQDIPDESLVKSCALEHGVDFGELNECSSRNDGSSLEMLRDSVRRSRDAGVTKSCTVRLNEEIYCIRDGDEWTNCPHGSGVNDLIVAIEKLYNYP